MVNLSYCSCCYCSSWDWASGPGEETAGNGREAEPALAQGRILAVSGYVWEVFRGE